MKNYSHREGTHLKHTFSFGYNYMLNQIRKRKLLENGGLGESNILRELG